MLSIMLYQDGTNVCQSVHGLSIAWEIVLWQALSLCHSSHAHWQDPHDTLKNHAPVYGHNDEHVNVVLTLASDALTHKANTPYLHGNFTATSLLLGVSRLHERPPTQGIPNWC